MTSTLTSGVEQEIRIPFRKHRKSGWAGYTVPSLITDTLLPTFPSSASTLVPRIGLLLVIPLLVLFGSLLVYSEYPSPCVLYLAVYCPKKLCKRLCSKKLQFPTSAIGLLLANNVNYLTPCWPCIYSQHTMPENLPSSNFLKSKLVPSKYEAGEIHHRPL